MLSQSELHEKILYPVVRIHTTKAGGSGTVIYSEKDPDNPEEYLSFVLTCSHVIDDAIEIKKDWDSLLKKKIEREFVQAVNVEIFDYVYQSNVDTTKSYRADIIAYDKNEDIAILKISSPKNVPYIAKIIPKGNIKGVKLFTPTWTSGCSLSHDPFASQGNITYLSEDIENKNYWMCNGNSIFGNSGGAVFLAETGEQIGITARITTMQLGFGYDVLTWMGFMVTPERIYDFLERQELKFLYDKSDTYKKAMERRNKKELASRISQKAQEDSEVIYEETEPMV